MKIGSYHAGFKYIDLCGDKESNGGSFWLCPGPGKASKIEIGLNHRFFEDVIGVLIHEVGELLMTEDRQRFHESNNVSKDMSSYVFVFNHCDWSNYAAKMGEYIESARKDLHKAWKKANKVVK